MLAVGGGGNILPAGPEASFELEVHFPEFGPISFWPEKPEIDRYKDTEWKAAAIAAIERAENPATPRVKELESPVAGLTSGGSFVHRLASAKTVDEFLRSRSLRGEPVV